MSLTTAEKQQIETAVNSFLQSAPVQATITNLAATAETDAESFIDNVINNAKVGGLLGSVFTALKGSAEAEVHALIAALPPATAAAMVTKALENELVSILGA